MIKILIDFNATEPISDTYYRVPIFPHNNPLLKIEGIQSGTRVIGYDGEGTEFVGAFYIGGAYGYGICFPKDGEKWTVPTSGEEDA